MAYNPLNPNGQATMANSEPVVIASNQSPVSVAGTVNISGNPSISGTVLIGNTNVNVSGSVVAAVTFPTNQNVAGSVVAFVNGTVPVNTAGSVVAFINGTVPVNAAGSVVAFQGTSPWVVNFQNSSIFTGVQGSVAVAIVSGSVAVATGNSSVMLLNSANVVGSVATLQGTNPWIVNFQNSSVLAVPVGSVITVVQANSIVGTYAEDAAHATADKGVFTMGVRNDTVASFTSANLDYGPVATDNAGRTLTKPFAGEEARVEGYITLTNTSVTTLVAAAGTGLKNYITDVWIANTGSVTTLVTFSSGGGSSVLGYTIAPAGGGSNLVGLATPIRTLANETFGIQAGSPTSILYATVKGFKAP